MEIQLAPMKVEDLDEVLALWNRTEGVGLNECDSPAQLVSYLDRNPGLGVVAWDGSTVIVALLCGHDGRRGYLHHLGVEPIYRNRGIARQMVDACLASLAELGIVKCTIDVYTHNDSAQQFWLNGGWHKREELLVMQRKTM